ncbi:MAG: DUF1565 domain-containing protein, partial [Prevotella sp.]|nr:DUF1565 domain-containing protein [Prevotella sp.]
MRKILLSVFASTAISASAADIYVAPNGADANDGSIGKPLKSLRIALRQARNLRRLNDPSVKGGVTIHVAKGTYNLYEPLYVRPEDSGTPDSPTLIKGDGAVISGGVAVTGWRKDGKLLVADTPEFNGNLIDFRQFYVNGKKAVRARDVADFSDMAHIRSLDKPNQIIYVPATAAVKALARQYAGKAGQYVQPPEMVLHEMW